METNIKANLKMETLSKVLSNSQMVMSIQELLLMVKEMDKEHILL